MDATAPALSVRDLRKEYGGATALDGVEFAVDRGSVVGLLGPNGAGKTTCVKCALGLVLPTAGSVRVAGVDPYEEPGAAYRRVGAMLEGARNVYWRLTVRENLEFVAGLAGRSPGEARDRHDALLDALGLRERADDPVKDLSRGMKQKTALAAALARDVEVAFLDEPTLGLDVEASLELRRELRRLADRESTTVVLSSHDMDVVEATCDRVIVLRDGRIAADDAVEDLLDLFRTRTYRITVEGTLDGEYAAFGPTNRTRLGDRTRFEVPVAGTAELRDLLDALIADDRRVTALESVDPDLEEVFLELTRGEP